MLLKKDNSKVHKYAPTCYSQKDLTKYSLKQENVNKTRFTINKNMYTAPWMCSELNYNNKVKHLIQHPCN